jgi:hypothetical protein
MAPRKRSVANPAERDGVNLPYNLETLDVLRKVARLCEDDPDCRALAIVADLYELAIARALHDLGRTVAPWHALNLCGRWRIPPPTWVPGALAAAAEALWGGGALPTPAAVRAYRRDLERLRAAADLYDRGRRAAATIGEPAHLGSWRQHWAGRLGLTDRSLERWADRDLEPVLERLSDPERVAEWEKYVRAIAERKGLESLAETIAEIDAEDSAFGFIGLRER